VPPGVFRTALGHGREKKPWEWPATIRTLGATGVVGAVGAQAAASATTAAAASARVTRRVAADSFPMMASRAGTPAGREQCFT